MKSLVKNLDLYPAVIRKVPKSDGGGYACYYPDLPRLAFVGWAKTPAGAFASLKKISAVLLKDYRAKGIELPEPTPDPLDAVIEGQKRRRMEQAIEDNLSVKER